MASGNRAKTEQRDNLDFAGFAQEFLRRNPAYADDYRTAARAAEKGGPDVEQEVMARRWGLCFSLRT